jgi:DnaJ-class molecular chaperone
VTTAIPTRRLTCLKCNGVGWLQGKTRYLCGRAYTSSAPCPVCHGSGNVTIIPDARERAAKEDYFE